MPFAEDEQTITLTRSADDGNGSLLHLPRRLGPVQLIREIGRGGMGEVWLGRHTVLARDVAVKFLLNAVLGPDDPHFERFLQEARTAAAVRHPHLVVMYDANLWGELPYLVMEYIDGPTLAEVLRRRGSGLIRTPHGSGGPQGEGLRGATVLNALRLPETLAVLESVAGAVGQLHDREIVHRDIKPSNILLDRDGRVVVSDFGLACGRAAAGRGAFVAGTPAYMAPEMFDGRASPRSDVYALAVMSFQLLTGELPFTGSLEEVRRKHISDALPVEPMLSRGVESALTDIVARAAHKNPTFRYKTAVHFLRALREAVPDANVLIRGAESLVSEAARHRSAPAAEASTDSKTPSTSYYEHLTTIAATKRRRQAPDTPEVQSSFLLEAGGPRDNGRTVAVDLPCAQCAYNLKGLEAAKACPECGASIEVSLRPDRLLFADLKWLRIVRLGFILAGVGALGELAAWFRFGGLIPPYASLAQGTKPFVGLIYSLPLGVWLAGVFLSTVPEIGRRRAIEEPVTRRLARSTALLWTITVWIPGTLPWLRDWRQWNWPGSSDYLHLTLALALVLVSSWMQYLRTLGRRIPDVRMVRHGTMLNVILVAAACAKYGTYLSYTTGSTWGPIIDATWKLANVLLLFLIPWIGIKLLIVARSFKRLSAAQVQHNALFGSTALRANAATMAPDESVPLSLGDGRISDAGASCRRCGYRLFGLLPDGQCPECGAAIAPSLEGDLLRFADPTWLARLDLGNRLLLWGIPLSLFGFTISGIGGAEPLILILRLIFGLLALYGGWLLTTAEPSGSPNYGFRGTLLIRPALMAGVLIDVGRVCLTLFPDSQLPRSWLNAARSGLETLFWAIVTFLLYSYCRSLVERIPDQGLAKQAGSLRSQLPICLVLAAPALVASRLQIFASDVESYLWRFIIVASGLAVVVSIVLGLLALRFHYRMGKKLDQQAALAHATWTSE